MADAFTPRLRVLSGRPDEVEVEALRQALGDLARAAARRIAIDDDRWGRADDRFSPRPFNPRAFTSIPYR
ncbi:acyl-CoA carboxylase epsilon subunit [Corynebacterium mastitidis]|uniref:acyl-CoA carboxylase epsilon subunit n=1 Tax=Corynebacterium mastitidis TaxID=161890 RepID=UPI0003638980|nr:acyl-CoA carboxylase epsilon subunit [Corynebacterium mastitidis]